MASRLAADIIRDFEDDLSSLTLRMFDDGRLVVRVDGNTVYDMARTGKFPSYDTDVKPKIRPAA